jgi:hypothetical protein
MKNMTPVNFVSFAFQPIAFARGFNDCIIYDIVVFSTLYLVQERKHLELETKTIASGRLHSVTRAYAPFF